MNCRTKASIPWKRTSAWASKADQRDYGMGVQMLREAWREVDASAQQQSAQACRHRGLRSVSQPVAATRDAGLGFDAPSPEQKKEKLGHRLSGV